MTAISRLDSIPDDKSKVDDGFPTFFTICILIVATPMIVMMAMGIADMTTLEERIAESKLEIKSIPCDDIERKLALDEFSRMSPHSFLSERYFAQDYFKYDCLGEERPEVKNYKPTMRKGR